LKDSDNDADTEEYDQQLPKNSKKQTIAVENCPQ
jgi:hypothetical protein